MAVTQREAENASVRRERRGWNGRPEGSRDERPRGPGGKGTQRTAGSGPGLLRRRLGPGLFCDVQAHPGCGVETGLQDSSRGSD